MTPSAYTIAVVLLWFMPVPALFSLLGSIHADSKYEDVGIGLGVCFVVQVMAWMWLCGYYVGHP